jgi:glycosyltransferase involved in cell wall biosynthesis
MNDKRIKVGMYTPFFFPVLGGTEFATYNLARELRAFCDIKVCTFNWILTSDEDKNYGLNLSYGLPQTEIIGGVCVHRYPIINLPVVKNFSAELIKDLSFSDIDILHFQGVHRLLSRWLLHKAVRKKIKILTTHALQESIEIVRQSRCSFLIDNFFINTLKNMDHIIALSESDLRSLVHLGLPKNKITVIPNGIDAKKFNTRKHFVERNEKIKILCVARFDKNKNYESLVYALSKLKNDGLNFEAYFIGAISDNEYFEKIVGLIKKKGLEKFIKIGVSVNDPALIDCYLSCDLFVLPSSMETFPLVILEAMYAGLPIVATYVGGVPDIVKNGVNGFLIPPNDPQRLYERCLQLVKDDKLRNEMGTINKKTVENYTWSKIASSTYNLYQQLMENLARR